MIKKVVNSVNGYKVYIGCLIGIAALTLHLFGVQIPNLNVNDADYGNNVWSLIMVMFGRSAMPDKKGLV
jgi:hypothetical protein